jgi:hypothetical protein
MWIAPGREGESGTNLGAVCSRVPQASGAGMTERRAIYSIAEPVAQTDCSPLSPGKRLSRTDLRQ